MNGLKEEQTNNEDCKLLPDKDINLILIAIQWICLPIHFYLLCRIKLRMQFRNTISMILLVSIVQWTAATLIISILEII